ncbi:hypothetical protein F4779DRAFT_349466 [Xylariaceae sp. FL0662B]|nr:hypothetical protein F4779DRAFT_349466 [Xylariaceae sp. FL0662B]
MLGLQQSRSPWRLHRFPLKIVSPTCQVRYIRQRRGYWPFRREVPVRVKYPDVRISDLVLDLDAEDNKYVRPFDKRLDQHLDPTRDQRDRYVTSVKRSVAKFEQDSKRYEETFQRTMTDKFHAWRITDHDILSVALVDVPENARLPDRPELAATTHGLTSEDMSKAVLEWNGIPHLVRDSGTKTTRYMLRRRWVTRRHPPGFTNEGALNETLQDCQAFSDVERLVTYIIGTKLGYQLVFKSIPALVDACQRTANTGTPTRVLSFLNNLELNLSSRNMPISRELSLYAFEFSLQYQVFPTAQKYLRMCLDSDHQFSSSDKDTILKTLETSISAETENTMTCIRLHPVDRLLAIYGLLTGQVLGEQAPQPSLHDIMQDPTESSFQRYLNCLIRLGAFRTIWHICHGHVPSIASRDGMKRSNPEKEGELDKLGKSDPAKVQAFAIALCEAIKRNDNILDSIQIANFTRAKGEYTQDCRLDMEAIIRIRNIITKKGSAEGSRDNPPELNYHERIERVFERRDTAKAMVGLRDLLRKMRTRFSGEPASVKAEPQK